MLIRSQDKERIMNFTGASVGIDQEMSNDNNICIAIFYSENAYEELGEYSTQEKALKVLDMIQEAYSEYQIMLNFSVSYLHEFKEKIDGFAIFQRPEDSEVKA